MGNVVGIRVKLKTKQQGGAGTDDAMYLGVFGKGGGSEFPFDVPGFDDFKAGDEIIYEWGDIWNLPNPLALHPTGSQGNNKPVLRYIVLEDVDYVYLRKASHKPKDDDDAWKLDNVRVELYGADFQGQEWRWFEKSADIWLGNEYGHQVWLKENGV